MKIIIWGTGDYCKEKIKYIDQNNIVAIADRVSKSFSGWRTITLDEVQKYSYDKIVVLSSYYIEIIKDFVNKGIDYKKIVPGIAVRPFLFSELNYINERIKITVNKEGNILFSVDNDCIVVREKTDLEKVKKIVCNENNVDTIFHMNEKPVDKNYGINRGGSIVRYYINDFLTRNKDCIAGTVLEIGDREYTHKFNENVKISDCLHFGETVITTECDFNGNLSTNEGIKKDYYDCIVLTQVLNFVEDISHVADNLLNAIKKGGCILLTVSGITPICRYDMDTYGQYWAFTDRSIYNLFHKDNIICEIQTYGNYKTACAFLGGISYTEIGDKALAYNDPDYQVVIVAKIIKVKD